MHRTKKRVAVITGASSGMGMEFARILGREFDCIDEIWLIARRRYLLEEVRDEINKPCIVVDQDITDEAFGIYFNKMLKQENPNVKMLINCAGFGIIGNVEEASRELSSGMIKTNCLGLTMVTQMVLPYMMKNGRIINLSSASAFLPQADFAIYAATKSYVLSFSRSLNVELAKKKVYVTAVCPGPVATDFFRIAQVDNQIPWYKEYFMSDCESVVRKALDDSKQKKEISIYGIPMKVFYIMCKILPHRLILWIMKGFVV